MKAAVKHYSKLTTSNLLRNHHVVLFFLDIWRAGCRIHGDKSDITERKKIENGREKL